MKSWLDRARKGQKRVLQEIHDLGSDSMFLTEEYGEDAIIYTPKRTVLDNMEDTLRRLTPDEPLYNMHEPVSKIIYNKKDKKVLFYSTDQHLDQRMNDDAPRDVVLTPIKAGETGVYAFSVDLIDMHWAIENLINRKFISEDHEKFLMQAEVDIHQKASANVTKASEQDDSSLAKLTHILPPAQDTDTLFAVKVTPYVNAKLPTPIVATVYDSEHNQVTLVCDPEANSSIFGTVTSETKAISSIQKDLATGQNVGLITFKAGYGGNKTAFLGNVIDAFSNSNKLDDSQVAHLSEVQRAIKDKHAHQSAASTDPMTRDILRGEVFGLKALLCKSFDNEQGTSLYSRLESEALEALTAAGALKSRTSEGKHKEAEMLINETLVHVITTGHAKVEDNGHSHWHNLMHNPQSPPDAKAILEDEILPHMGALVVIAGMDSWTAKSAKAPQIGPEGSRRQ